MTWKPIETAPKDGTAVLVHGKYPPAQVARYQDGLWRINDFSVFQNPTHWMPLPPPPEPQP